MTKTKIVKYTKEKVKDLFENYPVAAHGIDHITRVRDWTVQIAKQEKVDIFLSEMAAWLHDIGRTRENKRELHSTAHHELSYQMCREWFKTDPILKRISRKEKLILLYAVRYHWNNAADKYPEAVVLRDADKLDVFGNVGVQRAYQFWGKNDKDSLLRAFRIASGDALWFETKTARNIFDRKKLFAPMRKACAKLLKERILPVKL